MYRFVGYVVIKEEHGALCKAEMFNFFSLDPMPKSGIPLPPHGMAHPRITADHLTGVKHIPGVARGSPVYPQPQPRDVYDIRPPPASQYEPPQYPAGRNKGVQIILSKKNVWFLFFLSRKSVNLKQQ